MSKITANVESVVFIKTNIKELENFVNFINEPNTKIQIMASRESKVFGIKKNFKELNGFQSTQLYSFFKQELDDLKKRLENNFTDEERELADAYIERKYDRPLKDFI